MRSSGAESILIWTSSWGPSAARAPIVLRRLSRRPGSISRWQNARVRPGSAFVVELAAGPLPADLRLRHVAAVLAL